MGLYSQGFSHTVGFTHSEATCSDVPLFLTPHLAHPEVGMGNQVAPLPTRLPGSQQHSGRQGSSGRSRLTSDRAGCQSPASLQSCRDRAEGPKGSTLGYSHPRHPTSESRFHFHSPCLYHEPNSSAHQSLCDSSVTVPLWWRSLTSSLPFSPSLPYRLPLERDTELSQSD